ncbi:MAG: UDP-N-acetylmuramate dehydrogenase [Candidatus Buchananbacteria bacterium]
MQVNFLNPIKELVKENEVLANHSTFKIGGLARYFAIANTTEEIILLVESAIKSKLSYVIIGGGSNILFNDSGFDGLVIKANNGRLKIKDDTMECEAGVPLAKAMGESIGAGVGGLEWAAGIPGTIGGAVRGNAGAYGSDMSKNIVQVKILRNGKIKELSNKDCEFAYRHSIFKKEGNADIILSAVLKLEKNNIDESKEKIKNILKERVLKFKGLCAGCVFKNIEIDDVEMTQFKKQHSDFPDQYVKYRKIPAAWLIDQCGLKGREIGGAKVSENHAGIIINTGKATAENVIILISIIKQKVRSTFNLQLMEEIEYIGF